MEYISTTYILETIKNKVKIINDPTSIRNISEKLYSVKYLDFMPKTISKGSIEMIRGIKQRQDPENIFGVNNNIVID